MRILIDARMIGPTGHGIARYVQLLAEGLWKLSRSHGLAYDPVFFARPGTQLSGFETVACDVPFLHPSEQWKLPRLLKRERAAAYHSPSFASLAYCPVPHVATIHDLIHLRHSGAAQRLYYAALVRPFARKAAALLSVSKHSAAELARWSGVPESSVEVAYNPIERPKLPEERRVKEILARYGLEPRKYFLALSSLKPHKNLPLLIEAYGAAPRSWPLAVTASIPSARGGLRGPGGVLGLGGVDDEAAAALLSRAGALFYPSLEEGFGRPPLEAAVLGVPVVVSDIPPHREGLEDLAAGEARWVDPRDAGGWRKGFEDAERGLIPGVSGTAQERILARYTVERLAEHMDRVYRRVLGIRA